MCSNYWMRRDPPRNCGVDPSSSLYMGEALRAAHILSIPEGDGRWFDRHSPPAPSRQALE